MLTVEERFNSKISKESPNDCWIWTGSKTRGNYGNLRVLQNNKWTMRRAHRVSYEIHIGKIPSGLHVLHSCDNPECVNPNHLFLGTSKDNAVDKVNKGRHKWGVAKGFRKLLPDEVLEIRSLYKTGKFTMKELGQIFDTDAQQVCRVVNFQTHKKVGTPN